MVMLVSDSGFSPRDNCFENQFEHFFDLTENTNPVKYILYAEVIIDLWLQKCLFNIFTCRKI